MSLYFNTLLAEEHRNQLIRDAAAWRRGREAKAAGVAARAVRRRRPEPVLAVPPPYCHRAAQRVARCAA